MASSKLIKRMDTIFQEYIRKRDVDEDGICFCISCGRPVRIGTGKLHAGHYYPRNIMSLRWNECNVNGQCSYCNMYMEGEKIGYRNGLIKKYGEKVIDELEIVKNFNRKYSDFEILELIKMYRNKIKQL